MEPRGKHLGLLKRHRFERAEKSDRAVAGFPSECQWLHVSRGLGLLGPKPDKTVQGLGFISYKVYKFRVCGFDHAHVILGSRLLTRASEISACRPAWLSTLHSKIDTFSPEELHPKLPLALDPSEPTEPKILRSNPGSAFSASARRHLKS